MRSQETHAVKLVETLLQFQRSDYLCDTVLVAADGRLRAHSIVLAATCSRLKSSLKPFYKVKEHVLMVPDTELSVLKVAMHTVYTGELLLPDTLSEPLAFLSKVTDVLSSFGLQLPSSLLHDGITSSASATSVVYRDELSERSLARSHQDRDEELDKILSTECSVLLTVDCLEENESNDSNVIFLSGNGDHSARVQTADNDEFVDLSEFNSNDQWSLQSDRETGSRVENQLKRHLDVSLLTDPWDKRDSKRRSCQKCGTSFPLRGSLRLQKKRHVCQKLVTDGQLRVQPESSGQLTCRTNSSAPVSTHRPNECNNSPVRTSSGEARCRSQSRESGSVVVAECCDSTLTCVPSSGFQCDICLQLLRSESALEHHKSRRHADAGPGKQFKCSVCSLVFSGHNKLKRHAASKHPGHGKFACRICSRNFAYQSEYKRHMSLHLDDRQFACQVCGKRFPRQASLNSHFRLHSGLKPFQCTICGKLHMHGPSLKRHMMSHTGERPHKCEQCPKAFKDRGELRAHSRRIHKVELPIVKPGVRILTSSEMAQHLDGATMVKREPACELDSNPGAGN